MIFAANFTWDAVSQLTATGIINGAAYGLLGVGFALILGVTGRFHFAYSFTYALAAYMVFWCVRPRRRRRSGSPPCSGSLGATIVGVGIERFVYRARRRTGRAPPLCWPSSSRPSASPSPARTSSAWCSRRRRSRSPRPRGRCARRSTGGGGVPLARRLAGACRPSCSSLGLAALLRFTPLGRVDQGHPGQPRDGSHHRHRPQPHLPRGVRHRHAAAAAWPPSGTA